ncbi:MAG: transposase [Flavobacteriales bacterium Tduv]
MIHWGRMDKEIRKIYQKGQRIKGQPAYSGISFFNMMLLSNWYDLSDVGTEKLVKETLNCLRFCGFRLENQIPYHTTLCRSRNEIVAKKAHERLLKKINKELEKPQDIVKIGVIVDANITVSFFAPKGDSTYVMEDRKEDGQKQISQRKARVKKETQSGIDTQGKWLNKSGKLYYGYKKHIGGNKNGMILAVHSVADNEHDSRGLKFLIRKQNIKPEKYRQTKLTKFLVNMSYFHTRNIKDRIHKKAYRNRPLSRDTYVIQHN